MKRIIILVFGVAVVVSAFFLQTSPEVSTAAKETQGSTVAKESSQNRFHRRPHAVPTDTGSLETLQKNRSPLDALWAAMEEGHEAETPGALKQLADHLETHADAISEVLDILKTETDDLKISLLTPIITQCHNPDGRHLITQGALQLVGDASPSRRRLGLELLANVSSPADELLQTVFDLSRNDSAESIRSAAMDTMSVWLAQNPDRQEKFMGSLLQNLGALNDERIQGRVLQIVAQQDVAPSESALKIATSSLNAPSANVRVGAVMVLGKATGEMKNFAMQQLESAYHGEANGEVKKNILTQIVSLGQEQASEILQRLAQNENSPLREDMEDYLQIIAGGKMATADEIYSQKYALEAERTTNFPDDTPNQTKPN